MFIGKNQVDIDPRVFARLEEFIGDFPTNIPCKNLAHARERTLFGVHIDTTVDIPTAEGDMDMNDLGRSIGLAVVQQVAKSFPGKCVNPSGHWHYPAGGYMGWHTNSDAPFERVYLVYSENGDSMFAYIDPETNTPVVHYDDPGWNVYQFTTPKDPLFWHAVMSQCNRFSFGFKIV
jgi:hypothetical protein